MKIRSLNPFRRQTKLVSEPRALEIEGTDNAETNGGDEIQNVPQKSGKYGLFLLNPPKPRLDIAVRERYPVDIVAIHGITGDAFETWTDKKSKTNWLRDLLPKSFPGVRVFSFGYPADVFFSRETGRIADFARDLLEKLKRERKRV
jgi:hypothetical protein